MQTITVYKMNADGVEATRYQASLLRREGEMICLAALFERPDADLGFVVLREGDLFTEWFYSDRWYNVFRIEDGRNRQLKGWYCNITRPAEITESFVRSDDLALDVFVRPNGNLILLDEDEFDALNLPPEERIAALRAVEMIRHLADNRLEPFAEIDPGIIPR
jgi:hypothetical protein